MAAKTSFKQQCPACEAMVPVKDHSLIGKKIDCPKCKKRFIVEEPPEEVDEADEGPVVIKVPKKAGAAKGAVTAAAGVKAKAGIKTAPKPNGKPAARPKK